MSGTETDIPDDDVVLAGEYVLGVLEEPARQVLAARAAREPVLATEIALWERQLAPLALMVPEVQPPAELWRRLQRAIGATPERAAVRRWQAATAGALALAAGLAAFALLPRAPLPYAVASLAPLTATGPSFVAQIRKDGSIDLRPVAPISVPSDRDLELWALPQGATKPVPLGVLPASGMRVGASRVTLPGGKLLVSLEPKGGSPTGLPTGPVLYGGVITAL
jgi:anti-sigma-K factor RskA